MIADWRGAAASMVCWSNFAKRSFLLGIFLVICLCPAYQVLGSEGPAGPANQTEQSGRILNVRKVLRNQYFVSRYPQIHYYILYITLRVSSQTYCTEYETPVIDEIDDVTSSTSRDVPVAMKGKTITISTPRERKLKVRLVNGNQC